MKIYLTTVMINLCFWTCGIALAQTIGLSGPSGTVAAGSIMTVTASGETAAKKVAIMSVSALSNNSSLYGVLETSKYYSADSQPGKFGYRVSNSSYSEITANFTFNVTIMNTVNGTISYEYKPYTISVKVAGKVDPPILSNTIAFASGDPNFFNNFTISGTTPTGGNGTYNYYWELVDDDNNINIGTGLQGETSSMISWAKDNTNYTPISGANVSKNVYLRRRIVSNNVISYSNKILIYDYTNANKESLIVKVQGKIRRKLSDGSMIDVSDEVNSNLIASTAGYFLVYDPNSANPETTFRVENSANGVSYKWSYYSRAVSGFFLGNGISFTTLIYAQGIYPPTAYFMQVFGSDGSYIRIPLTTR